MDLSEQIDAKIEASEKRVDRCREILTATDCNEIDLEQVCYAMIPIIEETSYWLRRINRMVQYQGAISKRLCEVKELLENK